MLDELIDALRCLPGVGPKSAQRMALHLLQRDREGARHLGATLVAAMERIRHCDQCRNFTEHTLCRWCSDPAREQHEICVVESPADVLAIERSTRYRGQYFLLLGQLSPLDGIGPAELGLHLFESRLDSGDIHTVTLATNSTVEGLATGRYIEQLAAARGISVLQVARGLPMGSELEFADGGTLAVAFDRRSALGG